jgi:hypothetical protein
LSINFHLVSLQSEIVDVGPSTQSVFVPHLEPISVKILMIPSKLSMHYKAPHD